MKNKIFKLISLATCILMMMSVLSVGLYAEESDDYDRMTEEEVLGLLNSEVFLDPTEIFGDDDRTRITNTAVFPYSACVRIICEFTTDNGKTGHSFGSGNMIAPDVVLTAAHVVTHNGKIIKPSSIVVIPGLNGVFMPYFLVYVRDVEVFPNWTNGNNYGDDIALLRLDRTIGNQTGIFNYSTNVSVGDTLTLTGYPSTRNWLYKSYGNVIEVNTDQFCYQIDTTKGQSGSGLYNSSYDIVGVNAYESSSKNYATRITLEKYAWIYNYIGDYERQPIYRLCNTNTGEHFYTANSTEAISLKNNGWSYENIAWHSPKIGTPIYRLYNSNGGEHFFTADINERNNLINLGWRYEGVAFYTDSSCNVKVYRLYNPNQVSNNHLFTTSVGEMNSLVNSGWRSEGIAWYVIK